MDGNVVVRAQRGDRDAFASLAVVAGDRLHAVAHRILRDSDLAEDATRQALLSVWRDLRQLRDPARFDAWSCRLLVRACDVESRGTHRWTPNLHVLSVADDAQAGERIGTLVDRDQLERGFRRLTFDHRAVVVLHHYLDLPDDEVAETVDVAVGTVRSRLGDAMLGLRAALEAEPRPTLERHVVTTEPELIGAVRSWLEIGPTQLPDRVLDGVLDEVADVRQRRRWLPHW